MMQPDSGGVSQYLSTKSMTLATLNNTQVETFKMSNTVIIQSIFSWNICRSQNDSFVVFQSTCFFTCKMNSSVLCRRGSSFFSSRLRTYISSY